MKLASPYVIVYQTSNSTLSKKNNPKQSGPYRTWIPSSLEEKKKKKEGNLVFSFKKTCKLLNKDFIYFLFFNEGFKEGK